MSINLVTYANQTVTPTNDAIIYERAIDQNGIFYGCNVTVSGNNVNITGGYGIVCGREFVVESESIPVTLAPSVPLDGRLYVRLDLADADNPIQLLTAQGGTLPPLEQDSDVNYTNGTYEMELATFTVGVSALSDVVETFETIVGTKLSQKVDYIVEQGTSNSFTYTKWNSGKLEAERLWNVGQVTLSTTEATNVRVGGTVSIPQPANMVSGTVVPTYVGNTSNSATFMEVVSPTEIRIAKFSSSNVTLQNITVALRLVNGTWK